MPLYDRSRTGHEEQVRLAQLLDRLEARMSRHESPFRMQAMQQSQHPHVGTASSKLHDGTGMLYLAIAIMGTVLLAAVLYAIGMISHNSQLLQAMTMATRQQPMQGGFLQPQTPWHNPPITAQRWM